MKKEQSLKVSLQKVKNLTKDEFYQLITFLIRKEEANLKIQKIIESREETEVENAEKEDEETEIEEQSLAYKGALIHPKGCVRSPKALAEGISANADTGELHSPTEINFLPLVYFPKEIG